MTTAGATSPGRFIVLEGIDGSGTTTQAKLLAEQMRARGRKVVLTREPSAGPLGSVLREVLCGDREPPADGWAAMALLFAADRLDHLAREVEPALGSGIDVVSDRYDLSSLAYQSATAEAAGDVVPWIRAINSRARRPDLTLVLDVSAQVAERRRERRGGPPELFERRKLQQRLREVYAQAEQLVPGDRLLHVDGEAAPERVARALWAASSGVLST